MAKKKKAIKEFEDMRENAELRVLSNVSLLRPLKEKEIKRMRFLMKKLHGVI